MSAAGNITEDIINELVTLGLLGTKEAEQAQQFVGQWGAEDLTKYLADEGILTPFQADIVSRGAARHLVMAPYVLTDILGSGSMGQTAKAISREDDGVYAIKTVPRKNILNLQTVADQVEQLKAIRHPRVSAMIHVGVHLDRVFLVWPFLEGGEKLEDTVERHRRLSPRTSVQIATQIASGLREYHRCGMFHGLLKPNDILIGNDRRVRILDFGVGFLLTCERGKSLLSTTTNSKTLNRGIDCASPESIIDPLDRTVQGDQYSLGCILYYCLTGQYPFPIKNPVKKMLAHQYEEPTPANVLVPEIPVKLWNIMARMLAKKPEERFPNIEAVIAEFQKISSDLPEAIPTAARNTTGAVGPSQTQARAAAARPQAPQMPSDERRPGGTTRPAPSAPKPPPDVVHASRRPVPQPVPDESDDSHRILMLGVIGLTAGLFGALLTWFIMRG